MKPPSRIPEIEAARGLLATWVLVYHAFAITGVQLSPGTWELLNGAHAVNVFIIISGFVITMLIVSAYTTYVEFISRRFLRLFPAFAIFVLCAIIVAELGLMPKRYTSDDFSLHLTGHILLLHGAVPTNVLTNAAGAFLNNRRGRSHLSGSSTS